MSSKIIMIVDDVESNRVLLDMILEDDFDTLQCDSGPACLKMLETQKPDLILLDVNMPGMTGYEVCTEIRKSHHNLSLPVIFVSAMDNVEERLAGFEAGGNEYITKPIDTVNLLEKINTVLDQQGEIKRVNENATEAMSAAMEAMTSSSELGQIVEFVKSSQELKTLKGVGEKFCEVVKEFGLKSTSIIYGESPIYIGCTPDSMEGRVLEKFELSKDKIVSVGVRTMVRSKSIGLLINDMPIHDESRYGRLKDHLMVLSSICEGQLSNIKSVLSLSDQRKDVLSRVIHITEEQIVKISKKLIEYDSVTRQAMFTMIGELEVKLFDLGLEEDQEEALMGMAYRANEKLESLKGEVDVIDKELGMILEGLYEVLSRN